MYDLYSEIASEHWHIQNEPWTIADIVISDGTAPDFEPSGEESIDTSSITADEHRDDATPPAIADSSKPPIDKPPSPPVTFEEPAEDDESQPNETAAALGSVASGSEISEATASAGEDSRVSDALEILPRPDATIIISKIHSQPDLVEEVVENIDSGAAWVPVSIPTSHERRFFVDDMDEPTFFAKVTDYSDEPNALKEMELAPKVNAVIRSEQAQQIAQKHGFSEVSYVEPLAMVDEPHERQQTIIYPYQAGKHPGDNPELEGTERTTELVRMNDVAEDLRGLLAANQVYPMDLDSFQLLVDGDSLRVLDSEHYTTFEPAQPTLESGQMKRYVATGDMHDTTPAASGHMHVDEGQCIVARQDEAGSGVELAATTQNGHTVIFWNTSTGEGAFVNVRNSKEAQRQIHTMMEYVPALAAPEAIAHIVGPAQIDARNGIRYPFDSDLEAAVRLRDITQVAVVDARGESTVSFNTGSGKVEVFSEVGEPTYTFNPPTAIITESE